MSKWKTFCLDEIKAKCAMLTVSRCSSCSCRKRGGRAGRVQEQASVVSGGVQQLWARATHQWFPIWWWVYRSETYNRKSRCIKLHDKCCSSSSLWFSKVCWRRGLFSWVVWGNTSRLSSSTFTFSKTRVWLKSEYRSALTPSPLLLHKVHMKSKWTLFNTHSCPYSSVHIIQKEKCLSFIIYYESCSS